MKILGINLQKDVMTRYEMENRFIDFAVMINRITDSLGHSKRSLYYADQMVRSASSAALNYGESMSAESKKDFIHKTKVSLKELRETFIALRIIQRLKLSKLEELNNRACKENNELISILIKTIQTAQKNLNQQ